jgi:hypothetical protein
LAHRHCGFVTEDRTRRRCDTTGAVPSNWTKDSLKAMPDYKDKRRMPTRHHARLVGGAGDFFFQRLATDLLECALHGASLALEPEAPSLG